MNLKKCEGSFLKKIKKGDIAIVLVIVTACILWFIPWQKGEQLVLTVTLDGERAATVNLSDVTESYNLTVGGCEILVEKDGVSFTSSECEDKLCEKRGKMTRAGDAMACVPEKVVVSLSGMKAPDFDSVVY